MVKMPRGMKWLEPLLYRIHRNIIRKFNECWIPDMEGTENLSGDLSHKYPPPTPTYFVGPLSRFEPETTSQKNENYRIAALISGPEPQRTLLEQKLSGQLIDLREPSVMFRGIPGEKNNPVYSGPITIYDHADDETIRNVLQSAGLIIARSGYSTIMDLYAIGRNAILVPTPGQTEQEYLAGYLSGQGYFYQVAQDEIDIGAILRSSINFRPLPHIGSNSILKERIKYFCSND
jgi:hypothetical protein